jgi:DNA-binding GntR family transcriptional regulator
MSRPYAVDDRAAAGPARDRAMLTPLNTPTLHTSVAEMLTQAILAGGFAPGSHIVEAEVARSLGVSRGPVREALAVLERDGLVVSIPRRGKFVVMVNNVIVDEIYSLRRLLEPYAIARLIDRLTAEKLQAQHEAFEKFQEATEHGTIRESALADIAFHESIYRLADHSLLTQAWVDNIASKLQVLVHWTIQAGAPSDAIANHRRILDAIERRDKRTARRHAIEHIDEAWRRASSALDRFGPSTSSGEEV